MSPGNLYHFVSKDQGQAWMMYAWCIGNDDGHIQLQSTPAFVLLTLHALDWSFSAAGSQICYWPLETDRRLVIRLQFLPPPSAPCSPPFLLPSSIINLCYAGLIHRTFRKFCPSVFVQTFNCYFYTRLLSLGWSSLWVPSPAIFLCLPPH